MSGQDGSGPIHDMFRNPPANGEHSEIRYLDKILAALRGAGAQRGAGRRRDSATPLHLACGFSALYCSSWVVDLTDFEGDVAALTKPDKARRRWIDGPQASRGSLLKRGVFPNHLCFVPVRLRGGSAAALLTAPLSSHACVSLIVSALVKQLGRTPLHVVVDEYSAHVLLDRICEKEGRDEMKKALDLRDKARPCLAAAFAAYAEEIDLCHCRGEQRCSGADTSHALHYCHRRIARSAAARLFSRWLRSRPQTAAKPL